MKDSFPNFSNTSYFSTIEEWTNRLVEIREEDITEFTNLDQKFILGRKVERFPTSSADVIPTDNIGDFNYDDQYMYLLVDFGGPTWRRAALAIF